MEIAVRGRHVELAESVKQHATTKVEHLAKYLHGMERAEVLFSDEKPGHKGDPISCELRMEGHGHTVRAEGCAANADAALEEAIDKAALQLTRLKRRLVDRSRPRHRQPKVVTGELEIDVAQLGLEDRPAGLGDEATEAS